MEDQDWIWIQRFHEGKKSAFEQIFSKYKPLVVNLAFRFVRNKETAEDIAQEVFVRVYEKKFRLDPKAKFSTWLYRVTVNASLDILRKKRFLGGSLDENISFREGGKKTTLESLAEPKSLSLKTDLAQEELKVLVQKEINQLPEKFKIPILLYQFQEMPYREIAKILGITEKAVERRLWHAKELLKKKLANFL